MGFDSKVALVTASSRGIGFGAAKALLAKGARVALCARDQKGLERAAQALEAEAQGRVFALAGDIGELAFLERLVRETEHRFGTTIDILINNNGGPPPGTSDATSEEQWQGALQRNLLSAVRLAKLVAPGMKTKRYGRIIHLASTTAKEPDEGMVLSNVTRAGVVAFSKTLSRELGPFGITVNTVLTGAVLTDRMRSLIEGDTRMSPAELDAAVAKAAEVFPVRYIPSPTEFAHTLLFLASEEARYVTGVALPLDGGYTRSAL